MLTSIYMTDFFYSNIQYNISSTYVYPVEKNNYSFSSKVGLAHCICLIQSQLVIVKSIWKFFLSHGRYGP